MVETTINHLPLLLPNVLETLGIDQDLLLNLLLNNNRSNSLLSNSSNKVAPIILIYMELLLYWAIIPG
jgi:hypothetical protein